MLVPCPEVHQRTRWQLNHRKRELDPLKRTKCKSGRRNDSAGNQPCISRSVTNRKYPWMCKKRFLGVDMPNSVPTVLMEAQRETQRTVRRWRVQQRLPLIHRHARPHSEWDSRQLLVWSVYHNAHRREQCWLASNFRWHLEQNLGSSIPQRVDWPERWPGTYSRYWSLHSVGTRGRQISQQHEVPVWIEESKSWHEWILQTGIIQQEDRIFTTIWIAERAN